MTERRRRRADASSKAKKKVDKDIKISEEVKEKEFSNYVELFEVKKLFAKAKNRPDADKIVGKITNSMDEIENVKSVPKGYIYTIHKMIARDGF